MMRNCDSAMFTTQGEHSEKEFEARLVGDLLSPDASEDEYMSQEGIDDNDAQ